MILLKKPPTTVTNKLVRILLQPWFLPLLAPILYFWQTMVERLCPSLSKTEVLRAETCLKPKALLIAEYHIVLLSASLCNGNSGTDRLSPLETLSYIPGAALWRFDWTDPTYCWNPVEITGQMLWATGLSRRVNIRVRSGLSPFWWYVNYNYICDILS